MWKSVLGKRENFDGSPIKKSSRSRTPSTPCCRWAWRGLFTLCWLRKIIGNVVLLLYSQDGSFHCHAHSRKDVSESMKKRIPYWLVITLLSCVAVGYAAPTHIVLRVINQSFLLGLFLLIAGGFTIVMRSGFLTVFTKGFRELKQIFFRKPRILQDDLFQMEDPSFQRKKEMFIRRGTSLLIEAGLMLTLFSIGLTLLYYGQA